MSPFLLNVWLSGIVVVTTAWLTNTVCKLRMKPSVKPWIVALWKAGEVQPPGPGTVTFFGKMAFADDQVKMRSLE